MCPIEKQLLDNILDNPDLTTEEQTKLSEIETTIDQYLTQHYDGNLCDIEKFQYFLTPLHNYPKKRIVVIYNKLVQDYLEKDWSVSTIANVTQGVLRFQAKS